MKRAFFLKLLLGGPFGWQFARMLQERSQERRYLLNRFYVAGFQYYQGPELIGSLSAGEKLGLYAEPGNSFDRFAVEIRRKGVKLGYVPQTDNKHISRLLRRGVELICKTTKVNPEEDIWKMLGVEVYIRL